MKKRETFKKEILRKPKEILRKLGVKVKKTVRRQRIKKPALPVSNLPVSIRENAAFYETTVESSKYPYAVTPGPFRQMPLELPGQYGEDKITVLARDPRWIYAYWEITPKAFDGVRKRLGEEFNSAKMALRVYDVSNIDFNGSNAHVFFDISINQYADNWYIETGGPGKSFCVDVGYLLPAGRFITIVRSNAVRMPVEGPSGITDEEWMVPEDMFARLYGMGFGMGRSSPVGKAWQEKIKHVLFSGIPGSPGIASMASPVKKVLKEKKFWLMVDCELIVYGATEPDAKVTVQGKVIKLRPEGTFTLRFALPDGAQVIPVKAVSSDNSEERTITPIVERNTK